MLNARLREKILDWLVCRRRLPVFVGIVIFILTTPKGVTMRMKWLCRQKEEEERKTRDREIRWVEKNVISFPKFVSSAFSTASFSTLTTTREQWWYTTSRPRHDSHVCLFWGPNVAEKDKKSLELCTLNSDFSILIQETNLDLCSPTSSSSFCAEKTKWKTFKNEESETRTLWEIKRTFIIINWRMTSLFVLFENLSRFESLSFFLWLPHKNCQIQEPKKPNSVSNLDPHFIIILYFVQLHSLSIVTWRETISPGLSGLPILDSSDQPPGLFILDLSTLTSAASSYFKRLQAQTVIFKGNPCHLITSSWFDYHFLWCPLRCPQIRH